MRSCTAPPKPQARHAQLLPSFTRILSIGHSRLTVLRSIVLTFQISSWITCRNPNDPHASSPNRTISHSTATVGRAPARHGGWRGLRDRARTLVYAARDTRYESWRSVRFGSRRPSADGACPASAVLPDRHFCLPQVQRDPADLVQLLHLTRRSFFLTFS